MTSQAATTAPVPETARSLRRDSIAFLGAAGSAVGIQAPSAGVSFLPALMAGIVGAAGPFAFGTAMVVASSAAVAGRRSRGAAAAGRTSRGPHR
jgi:hypothetical protein